MEAKGAAQATPIEASPAKRLRTWLWAGAAKKGAQLLAGSSWEEMSLRCLWSLAEKTTGMRSEKQVGSKWVKLQKEELVDAFRAFDAKKGAQPLAGSRWEEMSLTALRSLADKTPGIRSKKQVGEKWVYMQKEELVEAFRAFHTKEGTQLVVGTKTHLDKRLSKQAFQTSEEYKVKKRRRENAPKAKRQRLMKLWEEAKRAAKRAAQTDRTVQSEKESQGERA